MAGFLLGLTFLIGVVAEDVAAFFLAVGVTFILVEGEAFEAVGLLPGGDLLPAVEDLLDDPVGDVFPDEGGLGVLVVLVTDFTEVTEATDVFFGGGGGDSGGKLRGGGGGGGDVDAGGGEVKLLGPDAVTAFGDEDPLLSN